MRLSECPTGVYIVSECRSETLSAFGLYEGARVAVTRPCSGALPALIYARGAKAAVGRALAETVIVRENNDGLRYFNGKNSIKRSDGT